ncbi:MAG TPA: hypothetical protein VGF98_01705 [Candidatus Tumulicola sp.]|jgi:hypothetical protein
MSRIRILVDAQNTSSAKKGEVLRIAGFGDPMSCPVISIGANELLLNHKSHRVRAQLQDDAQWGELSHEPDSEGAQAIIAFHIRQDRGEASFAMLQQSLTQDGQTDPGIITHDGVLINGNTRAVAIREFADPSKEYIRVAVLPQTVKPQELNLLELRLQMQKQLKGEYSFTNELLFVEELKEEFKLSPEQIAAEMRIHLDNAKKGASEVELRLRMLDLIRRMQNIPAQRLPLRFFDDLAYEQLKQTLREYDAKMKDDPASAERYLETILLSGMLGITSVHQLRRVDDAFVGDYLVPHLEEDEVVGRFADFLTATSPDQLPNSNPGAARLMKRSKPAEPARPDIRRLIDVVNQKTKDVAIVAGDKKVSLSADNVRDALKTSMIVGIDEKKRADRVEDKLSAPVDLLKKAANELVKCSNALPVAMKDPAFDTRRQKLMEMAFKKLKKRFREVEVALVRAGVLLDN